jgi:glutaredoxin 3
MSGEKTATLYRMVLPDHICAYGLRAKELLEEHGYRIDDRILSTRQQVEDFEAEHGVETTPQISIDGKWIGGCDALERRLAGG